MLRDAHVVDIGGRDDVFRHRDGFVPEAEAVDAVGTLCYGEERLAVGTFHTTHQQVSSVEFDGAGIQHGIHHDALHQVGIVLLAEVIAPL